MFDVHAGYIVMISGAVTVLLRFLPFIAFGKKRPEFVLYLGRVLPPSVMAMLTVYCLKSVDVLRGSHGIPEALACVLVVILHVWKRNTLLSITAGTIAYMFMVQFVFA
ncbi:MAG: branched-chain amino acid transporter permease [Synergistaceae bacterium]|nr:branched-chain amino acid transporter permease [Synergistaceae bacterium]MBR0151892.1 branched-chain amino acid transporter permease [Synergistaceae bacterium]MBR0258042.1 branched-chain amino acid transporter permease [Synergistaceae bacterium]